MTTTQFEQAKPLIQQLDMLDDVLSCFPVEAPDTYTISDVAQIIALMPGKLASFSDSDVMANINTVCSSFIGLLKAAYSDGKGALNLQLLEI